LAKKKNLTREDLEDVSIYEDQAVATSANGRNGIKLQDVQIQVKCLNKKQKDLKQAIEEKDVIISTGAAGTGKTYLSLLAALHIMKTQPQYKKLILIKSLQVIKGEDIGYLPGTLMEKVLPYMFSYVGNLDKIFGSPETTKKLLEKGILEIFPIAYARGVTFDNCICIIDESQNIDFHTFKTLITRIGKSCKMIFLGDTEQIDRKTKSESCLKRVAEIFKGQEFAESITFEDSDSVRNPIIPKLLELLKED